VKILHTSDLHLGKRWRGTPLLDDQDRVLSEVLGLCEKHGVDMLLVTGDVFSDRVDGNKPADIARHFLKRLHEPLGRGRSVFLLRGNHDPFDLFGLLSFMMTEILGKDSLPLVVANLPGIYEIPGQSLQVVALPYLPPAWLRMQPFAVNVTPDEQVAQLSGLLSLQLQHLYSGVPSAAPTIFAGHVLISGAQLTEDLEFESGYHRELWLHPSDLPQFTSYNALGHIHLSQEIRGAGKPSWYAGAPDRLDLGEREYQPQVLLVTTPDTPGGIATVEPIHLTACTRWILEELHGLEDVERFCTTVNASNPIGEVVVADVPVAYRGAIEDHIRDVAPRVRVRWMMEALLDVEQGSDGPDPHDVYGTVRAYLERAFSQDADCRARLEAAFESLWSESSEVSA